MSRVPQHFRSSETQIKTSCGGCFAGKSVRSATFFDSSIARGDDQYVTKDRGRALPHASADFPLFVAIKFVQSQ